MFFILPLFAERTNGAVNSVSLIALTQILSWFLCIITDSFTQEHPYKTSFLFIFLFIIYPLIISIIYLINQNKLCTKLQMPKNKYDIIVCISWIFQTIIIYTFIALLINLNIWPLTPNGLDALFYGIQYFIFACGLGLSPILTISIIKVIKYLYSKIDKIDKFFHID